MGKKPFSGKQKKAQLQAKREQKRSDDGPQEHHRHRDPRREDSDDSDATGSQAGPRDVLGGDKKGVRSHFQKESTAELALRREAAFAPIAHRTTLKGVPPQHWLGYRGETATASSGAAEPSLERYLPISFALPGRFGVGEVLTNSAPATKASAPVSDEEDETASDEHEEEEETAVDEKDLIQRKESVAFAQWSSWVRAEAAATVARGDAGRNMGSSSRIDPLTINQFEANLDVWRQLWRTVDVSDVMIIVADARFPGFLVPFALVHHITVERGRPCLIVLNKIDLVPSESLRGWIEHLEEIFSEENLRRVAARTPNSAAPGKVTVLPFTCAPSSPECATLDGAKKGNESLASGGGKKGKKGSKAQQQRRGVRNKAQEMKSVMKTSLLLAQHAQDGSDDDDSDSTGSGSDSSEWSEEETTMMKPTGRQRNKQQKKQAARSRKAEEEEGALDEDGAEASKTPTAGEQKKSYFALTVADMLTQITQRARTLAGKEDAHSQTISIGLCGFPNVGKSSLLNCLAGEKRVSVSSSAGHTKHLQTIPIPELHTTLVDCPGIVFPMLRFPRPLQPVFGTHQIAQSRDPQSTVGFLASFLPLESIYGLKKEDDSDPRWSPFELCESYALKRGFMVKHGRGKPDVHRAAIAIVQEAFEGRLVFYLLPPPTPPQKGVAMGSSNFVPQPV